MTVVTIDDDAVLDKNKENKTLLPHYSAALEPTLGYYTRITIHAQKVDYNIDKELKLLYRPFLYTRSDNPATYAFDFKKIKEMITITGIIETESSSWYSSNDYTSDHLVGTSTRARSALDDLIKMVKAGGQLHLNWDANSDLGENPGLAETDIDVEVMKLQVSEIASDEDTPTQYQVIIALVHATDRGG